MLAKAGAILKTDHEAAWENFIGAHILYEQEIAWRAAALGDPVPCWPHPPETSLQDLGFEF